MAPTSTLYNPLIDVPGYYSTAAGVLIPNGLKESTNKGIQVSGGGYLQFSDQSLELYVRQQVSQSRRKWFIFFEMYRRSVWVRACIDWTANAATGLDEDRILDVNTPTNPDVKEIKDFLKNCNPNVTFRKLRWQWYQCLRIYGAAVSYVERDNNGDPLHIWQLDPRITFPITDQHGTILFYVQVYNGKVVAFMPEEILYFASPNNNSDASPLSPLETIYDSVSLELNANAYNAALFENDLNLGMVFSTSSSDKSIIDENDRILKDKYSRPENAGRHLILYGDMKLLRDGAAALKDINFEEMLHQCRIQACTALGVPSILLGIPEGAARAVGQIHERDTYVNTVRPLRQSNNEDFTKQFILGMWKSDSIEMKEPVASMLANTEGIEAASKVADLGVGTYNEYRQLLGLEPVPNGDYPVMKIPGMGGFIRVDQTAAPGLLDEHFDFAAAIREHQAHEAADMSAQAAGMQPTIHQFVPPMSYNVPQEDPIAARIIDISRSIGNDDERDGEDLSWTVFRRTPAVPGARGGQVYFTKNGLPRYGPPPANGAPKNNPRAPLNAKNGDPNQNTLTNPRDPNLPKQLTPEQRAQALTARTQVQTLLGKALDQNWTDTQFNDAMTQNGWEVVSGAEQFTNVFDARAAASVLSERYTGNSYTILGQNGQYSIMFKSLSDVAAGVGDTSSKPVFGVGGNTLKTPAGVPGVGRSLGYLEVSSDGGQSWAPMPGWEDWKERVEAFIAS